MAPKRDEPRPSDRAGCPETTDARLQVILASNEPAPSLTERQREILEALVELHIHTGEAVSSRSVAERLGRSLSPASVRNAMSELAERGYLSQPHTSAGRVPTDLGYRAYVDAIVPRLRPVSPVEVLPESLAATAYDLEMRDLLRLVSRFLARHTQLVGVVVPPDTDDVVLEHLQLVRLSSSEVMAVAISRLGVVGSRFLPAAAVLSESELHRLQDALNRRLRGLPIGEARAVLEEQAGGLDLGHRQPPPIHPKLLAWSQSEPGFVFIDGVANLLRPELGGLQRFQRAIAAVEQQGTWRDLPSYVGAGDRVIVRIGAANGSAAFADLAVILCGYQAADRAHGGLAVVGPKRMDYSRLIPLVSCTAGRVSEIVQKRHLG